jgi:hypothetical protein
MAAAVQRSAIDAEPQRFTLRLMRRRLQEETLVTSSSLKDWRDGMSAVGHHVRAESRGAIEW